MIFNPDAKPQMTLKDKFARRARKAISGGVRKIYLVILMIFTLAMSDIQRIWAVLVAINTTLLLTAKLPRKKLSKKRQNTRLNL